MTEEPGLHHWPIRVYYEDTDFSGVVYHAGYLRFLERARTELLRSLGISQSRLHAGPGLAPAFAVRTMTLSFVAPARMDDLLTVLSRVEALGGASVVMRQTIRREETTLVAAEVRIGFVAGGKAIRIPPSLRTLLSPDASTTKA